MGLTLILAIPTPDVSIYLHHEEQTMQHMKLKLAAAVTAALLSTNVLADSWAVTQTTDINAASAETTVSQTKATASSVQGLNTVNFATSGGNTTAVSGTQDITPTAALTLQQTDANASSTQAGNYASAATIGSTTSGSETNLTQKFTGTAAVNLKQDTALTSTGNTQGMNVAKAGSIDDLRQELGASAGGQASTVTLTQNAAGSNTQAANVIDATTTITKATQYVKPGTQLILNQGGTSTGYQAANYAKATTLTGTAALTQTVDDGSHTNGTAVTQTTTGAAATQGLNMALISGTGSGKVTQNVKGKVAMGQGVAAEVGSPEVTAITVGAGSIQAGNYIKADAAGASLTSPVQNFGDDSDTVALTQNNGGSGTTQAGNMIDMNASTATLASPDQNLENGAKNITLTQISTTAGSIQAGNLIKTSSSTGAVNTATQDISTTGTLTLNQNQGAVTSLQSGNAVVVKGTGGGSIAQNGIATTLSMVQGATDKTTTGSFQAVNYVGSALN